MIYCSVFVCYSGRLLDNAFRFSCTLSGFYLVGGGGQGGSFSPKSF